jgi:hypothetical protein
VVARPIALSVGLVSAVLARLFPTNIGTVVTWDSTGGRDRAGWVAFGVASLIMLVAAFVAFRRTMDADGLSRGGPAE